MKNGWLNQTTVMAADIVLAILALAGMAATASGEVQGVRLHEECNEFDKEGACDTFRASIAFTFLTFISLLPVIFFDFRARGENDIQGINQWFTGLNSGFSFAEWASCPNLVPCAATYPYWVRGDVDGFFALFFDNVATLLLVTYLLISNTDATEMTKIVYQRILPGFGISLIFGNVYYSWMAAKLSAKENRVDVTAQPYGINTPGAVAFVFAIMIPAYFDSLFGSPDGNPADAVVFAWRVGVAANFLSGVLEIFGALVGGIIQKYVPQTALLAGLAGVGLTFLAFDPLITSFGTDPIVAILPITIIFLGYFSRVNFGVPVAFLAIVVGTGISWIKIRSYGPGAADERWDAVQTAAENIGEAELYFPIVDIFQNFNELQPYLSTIVPISIINFIGTIECTESAHKLGDKYGVSESMVADGVGTIIGALFGSPFGTTVYLGFPAYKQMKAGRGYSLLNGTMIAFLCFTGLAAPLFAIVAPESVDPVIIFVGLAVTCQAIEGTPERLYPALLIGIFPMLYDWAQDEGLGACRGLEGSGDDLLRGLVNLGRGDITTSMTLAALLCYVIDRRFMNAAFVSIFAMLLSVFGIIHNKDLWNHNQDAQDREVYFNGGSKIYVRDDGWEFATAYALLAAVMALMEGMQRYGKVDPPFVEDESATESKNLKRRTSQLGHGYNPTNEEDDKDSAAPFEAHDQL